MIRTAIVLGIIQIQKCYQNKYFILGPHTLKYRRDMCIPCHLGPRTSENGLSLVSCSWQQQTRLCRHLAHWKACLQEYEISDTVYAEANRI